MAAQFTEEAENEHKLIFLRTQLYTAMQQLKGEQLKEFWTVLSEIYGLSSHVPDTAFLNAKGQWVPSIPEPYYALRKHCKCGRKFWRKVSYRSHFALIHILEGRD